jgi:hypothetical protein
MTLVFAPDLPFFAGRGGAQRGLEIRHCRWKFKRFGPI